MYVSGIWRIMSFSMNLVSRSYRNDMYDRQWLLTVLVNIPDMNFSECRNCSVLKDFRM